jgi:hypothetical protein
MERRTEKRWYLWAVSVVAVTGLLLVGNRLKSEAGAGTQLTDQPDRIVVVPIQVGRDGYGLAMVDMVGKTLWVYEINSRAVADKRLKLLAARNWQYDQLLQEYNTAEPKPQQVKEILEKVNRLQKPKLQPRRELEELAQPETD